VYDKLVELGVKPVVELSFVPRSLTNCSGTHRQLSECQFGNEGSYKNIVATNLLNASRWARLVTELCSHFVARYGMDVVSQWRFEVWNELAGFESFPAYVKFYNLTAHAVKTAHPDLRVGGPATMQLQHVDDMIGQASSMPIDFISSHFYPSDPQCASANDPDCFARMVTNATAAVHAAGLPFLLTEFNDGLQAGIPCDLACPRGGHKDGSYASAFVMRNIGLLARSGIEMASFWTFSDVFEERSLRGVPFENVYGLMNPQGVRKPAWRAFELLNGAGEWQVGVTVQDPTSAKASHASDISAFATVDQEACEGAAASSCNLQLFLANFAPMEGVVVHPRPSVPKNVTVQFPLPISSDTVLVTVIDDDTCNASRVWESLGSPQYPTAAQLKLLHLASVPARDLSIPVRKGGLVDLQLAPYAVVHIRVPTD